MQLQLSADLWDVERRGAPSWLSLVLGCQEAVKLYVAHSLSTSELLSEVTHVGWCRSLSSGGPLLLVC